MTTIAMKLKEEGIKEGIEKGIEKGKIETVRAMKQKGFDIKIIAEITGLSIEEIERL